jgi:hypothetical protein
MTSVEQKRRWWRFGVVVAIALACAVVVLIVLKRSPGGPKLLNEPTKAREVRPFSPKPDPRFDPLPIEPEKHGR